MSSSLRVPDQDPAYRHRRLAAVVPDSRPGGQFQEPDAGAIPGQRRGSSQKGGLVGELLLGGQARASLAYPVFSTNPIFVQVLLIFQRRFTEIGP